MSDNNQKNRQIDSTGEGNMDIDADECPPHGPKCGICRRYANHRNRPEPDDDETTHLKQKLLKHTADALQIEAGLHKKIAELRAELHKKGEELWTMKEEMMKKELEAEKGRKSTSNQPTPQPPPPREPTLRGRSPRRRSPSTSRAPPPRRSMSPPRRRTSPPRRVRSPYRPQLRSRSPYNARRRSPSPAPRSNAFQRPPPSAPRIRPFGPPMALNLPPTAPRVNTPTTNAQPTRPSVQALAMAAWRNAPPPSTTTNVTTMTPTTVVPSTSNAPPNDTTSRPDPNIERDESDYDTDSTERGKKKCTRMPKPPRVPKKSTAAVQGQRAFLNPRAPLWSELPRIPNKPQRLNFEFDESEARKMLDTVQHEVRFDLADTIRRIIAEVQSRRRNGLVVPSGPAYMEREWRKPAWYNDAKRIRMVCESEERQRNTPFVDLRLDLSTRGQPSHQADREEHARWAAVYGTPSTYPGVPISSTLQLDLLGIQAVMYFRQLVPTNRSYAGPKRRYEHDTPPGMRARTRWIALFIELLTQPYLYEQLVSYYGLRISSRPDFYSFTGSLNTDMRDLVTGLAHRGFTAQHSHWMYEWAMNYLRDAEHIHDDTSNHGDFPRGSLLSRAADRLREVGAPVVGNLPFRRLWSPPKSWNVELYFQERNRRLTLAGQQKRAGRTDTTIGAEFPITLPSHGEQHPPTGGETARAPTSPADARERDVNAASIVGAAGSSSGAVLPSGPPTISTSQPTTNATTDEDTTMEDVSQTPTTPSSTDPETTHAHPLVHPNAVVPYPPPETTTNPSAAPNSNNHDGPPDTNSEYAMDQD